MIVVTCPGQGAQKPGFLAGWLEDQASREQLERLSEAVGIDLITHGTTSDAETIRDTAIAQPLIVAAGILAWDALVRERPDVASEVGAVAGHSVGEITAAYVAGILDAETALRFVSLRANLMAEDAAAVHTSMSAVVGGDEPEVLAALESFGLAPANFNGGGQIVAAGTPEALEQLKAAPPAGARVIPLSVAGAFHTHYMANARDGLAKARDTFAANDPSIRIWSNEDGQEVTSGSDFVDKMVQQVARPVRWDRTMASFVEAGATGVIELTPAGTLVGLAKRGMKGTPSVGINTPEHLAAALELIDAN